MLPSKNTIRRLLWFERTCSTKSQHCWAGSRSGLNVVPIKAHTRTPTYFGATVGISGFSYQLSSVLRKTTLVRSRFFRYRFLLKGFSLSQYFCMAYLREVEAALDNLVCIRASHQESEHEKHRNAAGNVARLVMIIALCSTMCISQRLSRVSPRSFANLLSELTKLLRSQPTLSYC